MTEQRPQRANIDLKTVEGFGDEWDAFDQEQLDPVEHHRLFDTYFSKFPFIGRLAAVPSCSSVRAGMFRISRSAPIATSVSTRCEHALDRFGTRLEQRFTRRQIEDMMRAAGLEDIAFRDDVPFWVACGRKANRGAA